MKSRDVVGKRIVKVNQSMFFNQNTGKMENCVYSFELDDGTIIWPMTIETTRESNDEYAHDFGVKKPKRHK